MRGRLNARDYFSKTFDINFNLGAAVDSILHTVAATSSTGGTDNPTGTEFKLDVVPNFSGEFKVSVLAQYLSVGNYNATSAVTTDFKLEEVKQGLGGSGLKRIQAHGPTVNISYYMENSTMIIDGHYNLVKGVPYTFVLKKQILSYVNSGTCTLGFWNATAGEEKHTISAELVK